MLMQYLAFWFAIPELLGPTRLQAFNNILRKAIYYFPKIAIGLFCTLLGLLMAIWGAQENAEDIRPFFLTMVGATFIIAIVLTIFQKRIVAYLERRLGEPILERLKSDSDYRMRALN